MRLKYCLHARQTENGTDLPRPRVESNPVEWDAGGGGSVGGSGCVESSGLGALIVAWVPIRGSQAGDDGDDSDG